ncbi:response regulator [Vallitalea guaymasensis]|uniref:Stage 0 sporulation protein A homolog n=1 Tax=Vallitalea guaymasensis TaxID=1185412 RepID=A0A8J8MCV9_9FIRM|nr:response regulator [Vallitalea guaymasensis]QUH30499.1 response regulator [Vallitalea guaymasensis]
MRKRALLVNDSRFESLIMKDMLNNLGYDVELADEFDALYEAEQFEPNIVIVNYIMRKTRGDKLIKDIKSTIPDSKCLLSSSNSIRHDKIEDSVDGILHTPLSMFTLKDSLKRVGEEEDIIHFVGKDEISAHIKYCPHCASNLSDFNQSITFCPYCGQIIRQKASNK